MFCPMPCEFRFLFCRLFFAPFFGMTVAILSQLLPFIPMRRSSVCLLLARFSEILSSRFWLVIRYSAKLSAAAHIPPDHHPRIAVDKTVLY